VRHKVASKQRMDSIGFSRIGRSAVVMLAIAENFNKKFFAGTILPSIVADKAQTRIRLKARGTVLYLDNARSHLTSEQYANCGM
jgi:hypothetical protein